VEKRYFYGRDSRIVRGRERKEEGIEVTGGGVLPPCDQATLEGLF
jgi:hypothetical protein